MIHLHDHNRGVALIFITGCLWGSSGLFIRLMSDAGASAAAISFLRMAFAFVVLAAVTVARSGISAFRVSGRTLLFSAALGLVCHGVYNVFYSWAVNLTGMTVSAVLLNIAPVFTAAISTLCFHERITRCKCFALAVNVVGCVLAATGGQFGGASLSLMGILCGVVSGLCYALTAIFGRLAGDSGDPFVVSTYSYLFAAVFLSIFLLPWAQPVHVTPAILRLGFLYALIPTAAAYLLYYRGLQQIRESSKAPVLASMETVVAAVIGALVLGEELSLIRYLGIAVVMASIVMISGGDARVSQRLSPKEISASKPMPAASRSKT